MCIGYFASHIASPRTWLSVFAGTTSVVSRKYFCESRCRKAQSFSAKASCTLATNLRDSTLVRSREQVTDAPLLDKLSRVVLQMFGWFSADEALASRRNLSRAWPSWARVEVLPILRTKIWPS